MPRYESYVAAVGVDADVTEAVTIRISCPRSRRPRSRWALSTSRPPICGQNPSVQKRTLIGATGRPGVSSSDYLWRIHARNVHVMTADRTLYCRRAVVRSGGRRPTTTDDPGSRIVIRLGFPAQLPGITARDSQSPVTTVRDGRPSNVRRRSPNF